MTEKRVFVHRLHLFIIRGFVDYPVLTWGSVVLSLAIACWGWLNFLYPEWFAEGPFISALQVYFSGLVGVVFTVCCLVMLFDFSQRKRIMWMDMAWQFHHYQNATPPPHLLDYMMRMADVFNVGGPFRAFLASYPEDAMPTTEVVRNHLKMLLDEQRNNKG